MQNKKLDKFIIGTQYYRAPTPLPEEWEQDMQAMDKAGIDTIQLRPQWRWHERSEGNYSFQDLDELFRLAEKYNKKVLFKFMMETAPDYIYHKYGGHRIGLDGRPIAPGAHGAYYVGGWWPCFDNPDVRRKAAEFVNIFSERYQNQKNLILWNIWNEPRSRPIGECCCVHSVAAYRAWLKKEFISIEQLNDKYGKCWESFDTVEPPGMPHDYAELFLWRTWSHAAVASRLSFMYKAVKDNDSVRPVIAHVGACTVIQDTAGDGSDDRQNSAAVDFYGTSFAVENHLTNVIDEARPFMICDWLRSVSPYYWIYEFYPDWGCWQTPISNADFNLKAWAMIACGAKGILYWQYRSERVGNENDLSGLVHIDGGHKPVTAEAVRLKKFVAENESFLMSAHAAEDEIGILYSGASDMISRIEETGRDGLWSFELKNGWPYLYKKTLFGIYALFRELGYSIRWIDERDLSQKINGIKVLYLPEAFMLSKKTIASLSEFTEKGGRLIAEEGTGLRAENTWVHKNWPDEVIAGIFGVKITERIMSNHRDETLRIKQEKIKPAGFSSYLQADGGKIIGYWSDRRPAAVQKNGCTFIGTSLGAAFYEIFSSGQSNVKNTSARSAFCSVLSGFLSDAGLPEKKMLPAGVYERHLTDDSTQMFFIFNRSGKKQTIPLPSNGKLTVLTGTAGITVKNKKRVLDIAAGGISVLI